MSDRADSTLPKAHIAMTLRREPRSCPLPVALLILAIAGCSDPTPNAAPLASALDSIVEAALAEGGLAGAAVAVIQDGEPTYHAQHGWADLEAGVPVGPTTLFNMESTSKPFTGAALVALADEGVLDLDDPLQRWIPEFPNPDQGARISLRQLVDHTSGLNDYMAADLQRWLATGDPLTPGVVLDHLADRPLHFEPGTHWAYTNSGFYLAGMVIERASGRSWADYLDERFIVPGELTGMQLCDDAPQGARSRGYTTTDSTLAPDLLFDETGIRGDGGLCATALTVARAAALFESNPGLGSDGFARMKAPTELSTGAVVDYGLGLRSGTFAGHRLHGHTGGIAGYLAVMARFPDEDLSIAVLTNTNRSPADALVLFGYIAARVLEVDPAPTSVPTMSDDELAPYVGRYRGAPSEGVFEVTAVEGRLFVVREGSDTHTEIIAAGQHTFARADGSFPFDRFFFQVDAGVALAYSEYYNGMHQSFRQRIEPAAGSPS